jgi:hypothetical protein
MSIFTNRIVVSVSGGLVTAVFGDGNTEVLIVDHDNLNVGQIPDMAAREFVRPLGDMDEETKAAVRKFNQVVGMPEATIMARVMRRLEGGA